MHCACVLCVSPRSRPLSFNQETRVSSTLGTILILRQQKGEGGGKQMRMSAYMVGGLLKNMTPYQGGYGEVLT